MSQSCWQAPSTSPVWPPILARATSPSPSVTGASIATTAKQRECNGEAKAKDDRPPGWAAYALRQAGLAGIGQPEHQDGHHGTAQQSQGQRGPDLPQIYQQGQGVPAQSHRKNKRENPIAADLAVFHDFQSARRIKAAPKPIGTIGEPIFVHGSGQQHLNHHKQPGGHPR